MLEFMSYSFALSRRAKADCMAALEAARARGYARIALIGPSDLAEIAAICALDGGFAVTAVVDANVAAERVFRAPVGPDKKFFAAPPPALLGSDMHDGRATVVAAHGQFRGLQRLG